MKEKANLVGERVRQARLLSKPKITQQKLATLMQLNGLDIDQTQVSKIENGTRPVSDKEVADIAKVLNVSSSWLLGETKDRQRLG